MSLSLLPGPSAAAAWLGARMAGAGSLRSDSRAVQPGDAFIAWPGAAVDGRRFVPQALAAGAAACLVDADGVEAFVHQDGGGGGVGGVSDVGGFKGFDGSDPRIAALPGLKAAAGEVASLHFGQPSRALVMLAVTGTNGKTSTACWLAQALAALGRRCAVVGTLGVGEWPADDDLTALQATGLTTPDAVTLQAALRGFVDGGITHGAIEASSIGLEQQRLAGTHIEVAIFTNLTRDHLDFHGSMQAYGAAKRRLFAWPGLGAAVVNIDDGFGAELAVELAAELAAEIAGSASPALWTVSLQGPARLRAERLQHGPQGLAFDVVEAGSVVPVQTRLVGAFNAANLLGVIAALRALGVPLGAACAAAAGVRAVPGRMEHVVAPAGAVSATSAKSAVSAISAMSEISAPAAVPAPAAESPPAPSVIVDYAHTPDALQQVLAALRPMAAARGGRLWCVFGCGGNRDASKRPLMGAIAAAGADRVVITSDNPRDEVPAAILAQVLAGMPAGLKDGVASGASSGVFSGASSGGGAAVGAGVATSVIEDRREAIAHAIATAAPQDVVLLAGKGHEPYQEVAGVRRPFSDLFEARQALARRQVRAAGVLT